MLIGVRQRKGQLSPCPPLHYREDDDDDEAEQRPECDGEAEHWNNFSAITGTARHGNEQVAQGEPIKHVGHIRTASWDPIGWQVL